MVNTRNVMLDKVEELTVPALTALGMELVDLQFVHEHGQWVLRYFIDKEKGVTLDDCATVSEQVGQILDTSDAIAQSYSLEVSSPGINRPLKKENDFRRFIGERADISLYAPLDGRRHFKGVIESVNGDTVTIRDEADEVFALSIERMAKAKLDPEITF